jgi:hypothetical protein
MQAFTQSNDVLYFNTVEPIKVVGMVWDTDGLVSTVGKTVVHSLGFP